jgi:hypothetical protein
MQLVNYKTMAEKQGNFMLVYSPVGTGKTATVIQTSPDPIIYVTSEDRKIETTVAAINRPDLRMRVGVYDGFEDLIQFLHDTSKFKGAKTIIKDSLSHLMMVHLCHEILAENYESKSESEKKQMAKALTMQVKMSQEAYGVASNQMTRLMSALQGLAKIGYDVICTARQIERPKWNRALQAAPALLGQEFSKSMDGYFDFICLLEPDERDITKELPMPGDNATTFETWKKFAPQASFNANESFLAKWTGKIPAAGIVRRKFNVKKVFEEANGMVTAATPKKVEGAREQIEEKFEIFK